MPEFDGFTKHSYYRRGRAIPKAKWLELRDFCWIEGAGGMWQEPMGTCYDEGQLVPA
jgi:hypothetical protein